MGKFGKLRVLLCAVCLGALCSCAPAGEENPFPAELERADLVVYTTLEEAVYLPVVKEFEERTDLRVRVENGTSADMLRKLAEGDAAWDVVFGVGIETLEEAKEWLTPYACSEEEAVAEAFRSADGHWIGFSAQPLVILYNTNLVTYRELPEGWKSLLEPRWRGRVAFGNPEKSEVYAAALATAAYTSGETDYPERLAENMEYQTVEDCVAVNAGIVDGRYSLGVTMEEAAQALLQEGADIDYIYPKEGTAALPDGSGIVSGCEHEKDAKQFVDFTVSTDVQRILVSELNRRSVRSDVTPPYGLSSFERLLLADMRLSELAGEKIRVLERWRQLPWQAERGE